MHRNGDNRSSSSSSNSSSINNNNHSYPSDADSDSDFTMDEDTQQQFEFDEEQEQTTATTTSNMDNGAKNDDPGMADLGEKRDHSVSMSMDMMMSTPSASSSLSEMEKKAVHQVDKSDVKELLQPIFHFYSDIKNYECMPRSGKVVVVDIDIPVKEAFHIAAQNDISFATLWDGQEQALVGMLTVTDLIDILLHYQARAVKEFITTNNVRDWRLKQAGRRNRPKKFVYVTPEDSLLTSLKTLHGNRIHRLPVISRGSLLQIITHSHLLAYMVYNISLDLPIFRCSLEELGIGTFDKIVTATPDKTVHEVLMMFAKHHISAVPIVDHEGSVIDVFSRYDIVYIIRAGDEHEMEPESYSLDYPVAEAIKMKPKIPVFTCTKSESLGKVLRHLAGTRIHRLVCVDEVSRVIGIISISDIFSWLISNLSL